MKDEIKVKFNFSTTSKSKSHPVPYNKTRVFKRGKIALVVIIALKTRHS